MAAEASARAVATFDGRGFASPAAFCEESHRALTGTRGAALALAHVAGGTVRFAGLGNIAGSLVAGRRSAARA